MYINKLSLTQLPFSINIVSDELALLASNNPHTCIVYVHSKISPSKTGIKFCAIIVTTSAC